MSPAATRRLFLGGLVVAALLPVTGRLLRGPAGPRCAADGVVLERGAVVEVVPEGGSALPFCCVGCADRWLRSADPPPSRVLVRDEETGRLVDARDAWFVRSRVVAQPATEDRVHAFASRLEAERHASVYRGRILTGEERPFEETP